MTTIAGRAWEAGRSRVIDATLEVAAGEARLTDDAGATLVRSPRDALRVDGGLGRVARRVRFPDGAVFEAEDAAALDGLSRPGAADRLHASERFRPRLALVAAGCLGGAFLVWRHALAALVTLAVWLTPAPLERAIDRGTLSALDRVLAEPSALPPDARARSRAVFDGLLAALPDGGAGARYALRLRAMPGLGPNAMALPGGTIVLTDAFVEALPDADMQAAVLGHEIGHVEGRHGLRRLYRSVGTHVLVAMIAGDTGPILEDVLLEGQAVLALSHSRAHERDADAFGLRLAEAAGHDPAAMMRFFVLLRQEAPDAGPGWLATHPAHEERMEAHVAGR